MRFLLRAFLEIVYAIVVFIIANIAAGIAWRIFLDFGNAEHVDRSNDAAIGFAFLVSVIVLIAWIIFRIIYRRRRRS